VAVSNSSIAAVFEKLADLLDIEGANPFRIRAYRNAARLISVHPGLISETVKRGEDLTYLPGIGKDLAAKVAEIVKTGRLSVLEEAKQRTPSGLTALLEIPGIGPKRIQALKNNFKITDIDSLERIVRAGRLRELPGFGPKLERVILEELRREKPTRVSLFLAEEVARDLVGYLKKIPGVLAVMPAGSYRRSQETVGDLDILVTRRSDGPVTPDSDVMEKFVSYDDVEKIVARGETRSTVLLKNHLQVDLRLVDAESYGAALVYFTGSKAHNIAIRMIGVKNGLKINEYGVFRRNKRVGGRTEEEVYGTIGLPWIPPELRENRGEIEAAQKGAIPELITLEQIRGDLHAHTDATDGHLTLQEMVEAARSLGYEYLAITDHTRHLTVAKGQDPKRLAEQIRRIDKLNSRLKGFRVLKSAEIDILEDGSLDLPDSILKELDLRVCSVHFKFNLSRAKQTERIIRAMDNRYFNILGHPTGRLIGRRPAYDVDHKTILEAAVERKCFIELNSQPDRLDLADLYCQKAKSLGLKIAISTDAHSDSELSFIRFGVAQARRAWLGAEDVLNSQPWAELEKFFKK